MSWVCRWCPDVVLHDPAYLEANPDLYGGEERVDGFIPDHPPIHLQVPRTDDLLGGVGQEALVTMIMLL